MSDDNGGWLLAPRARAYNEKERQDAQAKVTVLNQTLLRIGIAPAKVLRDAPTGPLLLGSRIANVLGFPVTFIEDNRDFDGVSLGGEAFVSPSAKHPEVALIGHEVLHSLKRKDPTAYTSLSDHIRPYLKAGVVDAKRQWEDKHGGKNTTQAKAEEEVIADLNGAMWLDPKFWREMAQNDPSLFRKVAYKFMEVATKVMKPEMNNTLATMQPSNKPETQPQQAIQNAGSKPTPEQESLPNGGRLIVTRSHFNQRVSEETMQLIRDERSGKRSMPEYAQ